MRLRELTLSDLESIHLLFSDWQVVRYTLLPRCTSLEQTRKCLDDLHPGGRDEKWRSMVRAIEIEDSVGLVGLCGISAPRGSDEGEIWYLVRPDQWRRGIGTGAARALLRIGFSELNFRRVFATCIPANPASLRVLEKIGMSKERLKRRGLRIHGLWCDCLVYGIAREEWEASQPAATMAAAAG